MLDASPAPTSTKTLCPARVNSYTACGASATLLSPWVLSVGIPILIVRLRNDRPIPWGRPCTRTSFPCSRRVTWIPPAIQPRGRRSVSSPIVVSLNEALQFLFGSESSEAYGPKGHRGPGWGEPDLESGVPEVECEGLQGGGRGAGRWCDAGDPGLQHGIGERRRGGQGAQDILQGRA